MADELKENVTTPWMQNDLTAEEISRDDQAGENTGFWILRGKGSGRDRFINLKNLRVWIQAAVDAIAYIKDNGIDGIKKALSFESDDKKTDIEAGSITFWEGANSYGLFIDDDSLHYGGPIVFEDLVTVQSKTIFTSFSEGTTLEVSGERIEKKDSDGNIVATFSNNAYFLGVDVKNTLKAGTVSTDSLVVSGGIQCNKNSDKVSIMRSLLVTGGLSIGTGASNVSIDNGVLNIGTGTSQISMGAGLVSLSELAFKPIDFNPTDPTSYPASAHPFQLSLLRYNGESHLFFSNGTKWIEIA